MSTAALTTWRNAVFVLFFINGAAAASWVGRIPQVRDDTGSNVQLLGTVLLAASTGAVLGLISANPLLELWGVRRVLNVFVTGYLLSIGLIGIASSSFGSLGMVAIGLFLTGYCIGLADVVVNIEGAAAERAIGKTLMPMMHAFFSAGTVAGALVSTAMVGLGVSVGWQLSVTVAVLLPLAFWGIAQMPVVDVPHRPEPTPGLGLRDRLRAQLAIWRDPGVWLIGLGMLTITLTEGAAGDWMALGGIDGHGWSAEISTAGYGAFVAGMTLMRALGGPIIDRIGRVAALRTMSAVALLGVAGFIFAPSPAIGLPAAVLWGIGVALGYPLGTSAAADHPNGSARVGAVSLLAMGSFLAGPPVFGLIGHAIGILNALTLLLPLTAIALFLAPAAREQSRPAPLGQAHATQRADELAGP